MKAVFPTWIEAAGFCYYAGVAGRLVKINGKWFVYY